MYSVPGGMRAAPELVGAVVAEDALGAAIASVGDVEARAGASEPVDAPEALAGLAGLAKLGDVAPAVRAPAVADLPAPFLAAVGFDDVSEAFPFAVLPTAFDDGCGCACTEAAGILPAGVPLVAPAGAVA